MTLHGFKSLDPFINHPAGLNSTRNWRVKNRGTLHCLQRASVAAAATDDSRFFIEGFCLEYRKPKAEDDNGKQEIVSRTPIPWFLTPHLGSAMVPYRKILNAITVAVGTVRSTTATSWRKLVCADQEVADQTRLSQFARTLIT